MQCCGRARDLSVIPRGSINTPIMELGSQNHSRDGLLGPINSIMVYMDTLGSIMILQVFTALGSGLQKKPG